MRVGAAIAIALLAANPVMATPAPTVLRQPPQRQAPTATIAPAPSPMATDPWAFQKTLIAPGVSLIVGLISLGWNWRNSRATQRIAVAMRRSTRKTAALSQYRLEAMAILKELRTITNELTAIPSSANYNGVFKPIQDRFIGTARRLRNTLEMISHDPEVDGTDWLSCFGGTYDHFLDCSNTLLAPQTNDQDHQVARTRLAAIGAELQADVLKRFSDAMDAAQA